MGQINRRGRHLSLRKSLVLYVSSFVILALILSMATFSICSSMVEGIRSSYPPSGEKYYLTNEHGEQLGDGVYIGEDSQPLSSLRLEDVEREHILRVLAMTEGRVAGKGGAAELLDMNPSTLRARMQKLNIGKNAERVR